jgi:hypothetical protein
VIDGTNQAAKTFDQKKDRKMLVTTHTRIPDYVSDILTISLAPIILMKKHNAFGVYTMQTTPLIEAM